jgi:prohibitin 2
MVNIKVPKIPVGSIAAIIGVSGSAYGLYNSVVTVPPGSLGMVYSRIDGLENQATLKEGLNFVVPFFQRPIVYDIRTRPQVSDHMSIKMFSLPL